MARRYCGRLSIEVLYRPRVRLGSSGTDWYYCRVTLGRTAQVLEVHAPAAGFGPRVAYDSSEAYDRIARAAVEFACEERSQVSNDFDAAVEFEEREEVQGSGRRVVWRDLAIRRKKYTDREVRKQIAAQRGDRTEEERKEGV